MAKHSKFATSESSAETWVEHYEHRASGTGRDITDAEKQRSAKREARGYRQDAQFSQVTKLYDLTYEEGHTSWEEMDKRRRKTQSESEELGFGDDELARARARLNDLNAIETMKGEGMGLCKFPPSMSLLLLASLTVIL